MTAAEQLINKGMQKEKQEMARRMLFDESHKYSVDEVHRITGLDIKDIEHLADEHNKVEH